MVVMIISEENNSLSGVSSLSYFPCTLPFSSSPVTISILALGKFGTNFGIAYQLTDDFLDDEQPQNFDVNLLLQAKIYSEKAKRDLDIFENNEYKKHLLNLIQYVINRPNLKLKESQDQCI